MIVEVVGGGGRGGGRETPEHRMMMAGSVARVPVWSILPRFVFEQSFLGGGKFVFFFSLSLFSIFYDYQRTHPDQNLYYCYDVHRYETWLKKKIPFVFCGTCYSEDSVKMNHISSKIKTKYDVGAQGRLSSVPVYLLPSSPHPTTHPPPTPKSRDV